MKELDELQTYRNRFDGQLSIKNTDRLFAIVEAMQMRVLVLETVCEFITDMEGQDEMTDAIFAEKTLALIHAAMPGKGGGHG